MTWASRWAKEFFEQQVVDARSINSGQRPIHLTIKHQRPAARNPLDLNTRSGSPASKWLALRAEKRGPLGLDDALDAASAGDEAWLADAIVDAMVVLIAARFVQRVAIGAVGKGRTFVANRHFENLDDRGVDSLPLVAAEPIAAAGRMNSGTVQDFGRVEISNPGDRSLVEQRDLDGATASAKSIS
jgi:hypothetical protein